MPNHSLNKAGYNGPDIFGEIMQPRKTPADILNQARSNQSQIQAWDDLMQAGYKFRPEDISAYNSLKNDH